MTEEKKPEFKWVKPTDRSVPQIYTNYAHVSWSLFDVRFIFGQLVPSAPGTSPDFVVEEQGAVTAAWPEAKVLRDMLIDLIARYEQTNGEIKPMKLPPNTPVENI